GLEAPEDAKPLSLPFLPKSIAALFNSFNPGIAGLILLGSSLFRGVRMSFFAIPAAAITWIGPSIGLGIWPSMGIGLIVAVVGVFFGRTGYWASPSRLCRRPDPMRIALRQRHYGSVTKNLLKSNPNVPCGCPRC